MKRKVCCVVGARPNFMKMAPLVEALSHFTSEVQLQLIHTGQHYDERLSTLLFRQLELPEPDFHLGVGSANHAEQTGKIMIAFNDYLDAESPEVVVVVGDVNSTLACALTAAKKGIPVAHVEAGLRSRDRTMPEEINRVLTDSISDLLFTPSLDANRNLELEGISHDRIHFVGNVMIDSLRRFLPKAIRPPVLKNLADGAPFGVVTLHRPSNVDHPSDLRTILQTLARLSRALPLIFPTHPRTLSRLEAGGFSKAPNDIGEEGVNMPESQVWLTPPLGYLEFLYLMKEAEVILTDSGGIQEEAAVLGVPCLTLRENTERPITVEMGGNILVGNNPRRIEVAFNKVMSTPDRKPRVPEKWDGGSSEEIAEILVDWLRKRRSLGDSAGRPTEKEAPC